MTRTLIAIALGAILAHTARADDLAVPSVPATQWSSTTGIAAGCAAAALKDATDSHSQRLSASDALITCAGSLLGVQAGRVVIRRIPGGAQVLFQVPL